MPPKQATGMEAGIFSLQGNIGSGKSTFLKRLARDLNHVEMLAEPVCSWQSVGEQGFNLLDLYYKDPSRWGLTFQQYALMTRVQTWRSYQDSESQASARISERSVLADKQIFAASMHDSTYLSDDEYSLYLSTFDGLNEMMGIRPLAGIIYLKCDPHVCQKRIQKRNRSEQGGIPFDYLSLLHQKHENWLNNPMRPSSTRVLVLDVSEDINGNEGMYAEFVERVRNFIAQ